MMSRYDGLLRLAFAALSAGLIWLAGRALRGVDWLRAAGYQGPARLVLALATALLSASKKADAVAFHKARA